MVCRVQHIDDECDCSADDDLGIPLGVDPDCEHEICVVRYTGSGDGVGAVVVYLDDTLVNYNLHDAHLGEYDGEEYADGYADGLSSMGVDCSIRRFNYDQLLGEDAEPAERFDYLDTRLLNELEV